MSLSKKNMGVDVCECSGRQGLPQCRDRSTFIHEGLIIIIKFISRFMTKNFINRLHLVFQINKIPTQKFLCVEKHGFIPERAWTTHAAAMVHGLMEMDAARRRIIANRTLWQRISNTKIFGYCEHQRWSRSPKWASMSSGSPKTRLIGWYSGNI